MSEVPLYARRPLPTRSRFQSTAPGFRTLDPGLSNHLAQSTGVRFDWGSFRQDIRVKFQSTVWKRT